jgi:Fe-S-cluster containining protein
MCSQCGACCVAPDVTSLGKAAGVRCVHLMDDNKCEIYDDRPLVCRQYRADEICLQIDAPTLQERVARYQKLFGLAEEVGSC